MNTDERGYFDALTEQVLGAVFEVSNTLGARRAGWRDDRVLWIVLCAAPGRRGR